MCNSHWWIKLRQTETTQLSIAVPLLVCSGDQSTMFYYKLYRQTCISVDTFHTYYSLLSKRKSLHVVVWSTVWQRRYSLYTEVRVASSRESYQHKLVVTSLTTATMFCWVIQQLSEYCIYQDYTYLTNEMFLFERWKPFRSPFPGTFLFCSFKIPRWTAWPWPSATTCNMLQLKTYS